MGDKITLCSIDQLTLNVVKPFNLLKSSEILLQHFLIFSDNGKSMAYFTNKISEDDHTFIMIAVPKN